MPRARPGRPTGPRTPRPAPGCACSWARPRTALGGPAHRRGAAVGRGRAGRSPARRSPRRTDADLDRLHRRTGGNPFFVTEVLAAGGRRLPTSVRDAVLARVARLSEPAQRAVQVASLAGPRAEVDLLEELLGDGVAAVDEPLERDVLRLADGAVTFRHELARRAVAEQVPAFRRLAVHRAVLDGAAGPRRRRRGRRPGTAGAPRRGGRRRQTPCSRARPRRRRDRAAARRPPRGRGAVPSGCCGNGDASTTDQRADLLPRSPTSATSTERLHRGARGPRGGAAICASGRRRPGPAACTAGCPGCTGGPGTASPPSGTPRSPSRRWSRDRVVELALAYSNRAQRACCAATSPAPGDWAGRALALLDRLPEGEGRRRRVARPRTTWARPRWPRGDCETGRRLLDGEPRAGARRRPEEHARAPTCNLVAAACSATAAARPSATSTRHRVRRDRDLDAWWLYLGGWRAQLLLDRGDAAAAARAAEARRAPRRRWRRSTSCSRSRSWPASGRAPATRRGGGRRTRRGRWPRATGELQRVGPGRWPPGPRRPGSRATSRPCSWRPSASGARSATSGQSNGGGARWRTWLPPDVDAGGLAAPFALERAGRWLEAAADMGRARLPLRGRAGAGPQRRRSGARAGGRRLVRGARRRRGARRGRAPCSRARGLPQPRRRGPATPRTRPA